MKAPPSLENCMLGDMPASDVLASVQALIGAKCIAEVSEYADLVVYARISEAAARTKLAAVIHHLSDQHLECKVDTPREGVMRLEISTRFG